MADDRDTTDLMPGQTTGAAQDAAGVNADPPTDDGHPPAIHTGPLEDRIEAPAPRPLPPHQDSLSTEPAEPALQLAATGARHLLALALGAACLTLACVFAFSPWTREFVAKNRMVLSLRHQLIIGLFAAAGLVLIMGLVYVVWRKRRAVSGLTKASDLTRPLIVAPLLPAFFIGAFSADIHWATYLAVVVLLVEWTGRPAFSRLHVPATMADWMRTREQDHPGLRIWLTRIKTWGPLLVVVGGAIVYACWSGKWTVFSHRRFLTSGYDLGQYDNLFWNTLNGNWLRVTPLGLDTNWSGLRNHADLGAFFLLPFYAIRPHAETLLIIQAVILGAGAIPIYLLAARHIGRPMAMILGISYLLYAPLATAQFYDFHFQPIAAVFILWAIYFVDAGKFVLYWVFFGIAISCREDISIGVTILGLFLFLSGHRPRTGIATALLSAGYFVSMRFMIMPSFGPWWFADIYKDLYPKGDKSFGGVMKTLITNPTYVLSTLFTKEKLQYTLQILAPLAFLPLRRSYLWLALVPGFILTLLTTRYNPTTSISFQYVGHFTAYCFPAVVLALAAMGATPDGTARKRAAILAVFSGCLLSSVVWGALTPKGVIHGGFQDIQLVPPTEAEIKRNHTVQEFAARVPRDQSIAAAERELPHVSNRPWVRSLRHGTKDADFILFGTRWGGGGTQHGQTAIAEGQYRIVAQQDDVILAKKIEPVPTPQ